MKLMALLALGVFALTGCTYDPCKGVQPYQQVQPRPPLKVPGDLSEPLVTTSAPEVDGQPDLRRPDGRCLEEPPPYERPQPEAADAGN